MGALLKTVRLILAYSILVLIGTACGGGGGGGGNPTPTPTPDTEPDTFTFVDVSDASLSTEFTSEPITVEGIDSAAAISIDGGEYSLDDGQSFSADESTVTDGQSVVVRVTSAAEFSTSVDAILNVGGVTDTYTVTTIARDITPDAFSFTAQQDVELGVETTSNTVTITGLNDTASVTIVDGTFSLDGAAFSSDEGQIENGQTLAVRVVSSSDFSTTVQATITVGETEETFSVETIAADITPDPFSFVDIEGADPSSLVVSEAITVSGVTDGTAISVLDGEYSIDGSDFTSDEGVVNVGQSVRVRLTSSNLLLTSVTAVLTIGTENDDFMVTTRNDTLAPSAEIHFPTTVSLTQSSTVMVRGVASDQDSEVTRVQVNGEDVTETSPGFATWEITVDLSEGENTLVLSVEDSLANADESIDQVVVTRGNIDLRFPTDERDPSIRGRGDIVLDRENSRLLLTDTELLAVVAVDLDTGIRTVLSDNNPPNDGIPIDSIFGLSLSDDSGLLYLSSQESGDIWVVDMDSQVRTLLSSNSIPNSDVVLGVDIRGLAFDTNSDRLLVADFENNRTIAVDVDDGTRSIFSDDTGPDPMNPWNAGNAFAIDTENNRIFQTFENTGIVELDADTGVGSLLSSVDATEMPAGIFGVSLDTSLNRLIVGRPFSAELYGVDIATGDISLIASTTVPSSDNVILGTETLTFDDERRLIYVKARGNGSVFVVDADSGDRVILTQSEIDL